MGFALLVIAALLFVAAVGVFITALRRPKEPRGGRQDPLKFASAAPEFGPRQLGPGAIVRHGGIGYLVRGSVAGTGGAAGHGVHGSIGKYGSGSGGGSGSGSGSGG